MRSALRAASCQDEKTTLKRKPKSFRQHQPMPLIDKSVLLPRECWSRIKINISGMIFETFESTLARFPDTLLGSPDKRKIYYNELNKEYFFNRNRNAFDAILFFYQSGGVLVRPENVSLQSFCIELEFFQVGKEALEQYMREEGIFIEDDTGILPTNPTMKLIWIWFEYPNRSDTGKLVACWSVMFIFISIFVLCAETLPVDPSDNPANVAELFMVYESLEIACVIWFTIEIMVRFVSSPQKLKFLKDFLNYIDVAAVLPFFVKVILGSDSGADGLGIMNAFRLLRVCRIFKLGRHMEVLQVLGRTVVATWRELLMILFFIIISMVVFSGLTYYAELDNQSKGFESIPATSWFVIVTLTNVGYGDMIPQTVLGKILGTACALVGVLAIALPSPVIATRFKQFYNQEKLRKKAMSQKGAMILTNPTNSADNSLV